MTLPDQFCWTRFGTEAAQTIHQIMARKEQERIANNGRFFWGIGNAVGPSLAELLRRCDSPEVLFSPIKSAARTQDTTPDAVVAWTSGRTLNGELFRMPKHALVTSRFNPRNPRRAHYALVCASDDPLGLAPLQQTINYGELRNILTERPVGASQVTSVVRRVKGPIALQRSYEVSLRVRLVEPYMIRLETPILLTPLVTGACRGGDWAGAVQELWSMLNAGDESQMSLPGFPRADGRHLRS